MAQRSGPLTSTWETWIAFLASGSGPSPALAIAGISRVKPTDGSGQSPHLVTYFSVSKTQIWYTCEHAICQLGRKRLVELAMPAIITSASTGDNNCLHRQPVCLLLFLISKHTVLKGWNVMKLIFIAKSGALLSDLFSPFLYTSVWQWGLDHSKGWYSCFDFC